MLTDRQVMRRDRNRADHISVGGDGITEQSAYSRIQDTAEWGRNGRRMA